MHAAPPAEFYAARYLRAEIAKTQKEDAEARPRVERLSCVRLNGRTSACLALWHGVVSGRKVGILLKVAGSKVTEQGYVE